MTTLEHQALKNWFERDKRDLPWRDNPTPYAVWVSEMMLQQTQVSVVVPYFLRWMQLFPSIRSLAESPLDAVIKCWEGLGYYARARALHAGAKILIDHYQGELPSNAEALKKIKGLGPYTIGAILSFAFKQKTAAVDGNVTRVLTRYFGIADDISRSQTIKTIWQLAETILPEEQPWIFNEALIELGASICSRKPQCPLCPLKKTCKAFANGNAVGLPYNSKKVPIELLYRLVVVVKSEDKLLIKRGRKGEIMSDLHEFPFIELSSVSQAAEFTPLHIQEALGLEASFCSILDEVSHSFTRYRVRLMPQLFESMKPKKVDGFTWIELSALKKLAFSAGHRRILANLKGHLTDEC